MKCQKCGQETFLPFRCQYCGRHFCSDHRLPENHDCAQIEQARTPKEHVSQISVRKQASYEYTVNYPDLEPARKKLHFSKTEAKHLAAATALVVAVGLSIVGFGNIQQTNPITLVSFVTMFTASFLLHEFAHKATAQKHGLWAEFRLTLIGAVLTLISALSQFLKIISPGAVVIAGAADKNTIGNVSLAGPATNLALAAAFTAGALLPSPASGFFAIAAFFNSWIALFNLIPFAVLDGLKIFQWDKRIWAAAFAAALALTATWFYLLA